MKCTSVHRSMLGMGRRDSQRGIVLPMTLILLLIMITMGSMTARNAATSVQISNNYRTNSVAFQAAEIGLRYCEAVAANVYEESGQRFPRRQVQSSNHSQLDQLEQFVELGFFGKQSDFGTSYGLQGSSNRG